MAWTVKEIYQRVRAYYFDTPELDLDPASVRDQFISNIWRRTITYIWGVRDGVSFPIRATADGALRVTAYGTGFTSYTTVSGTAADTYNATNELLVSGSAHRWDILIESNDAKIKFLYPGGVTFYSDIPLVRGFYSIPFTSPGIRIANRVAGSNATYHISAFK
jgi:hypothetical protein